MKKLLCLFLVLSLSMAWSISAFAAPASILNEKVVESRISNIMSEGEKKTIELSDGVITQYSADNGDIVHITTFNDGMVRYEYYCCESEKIYTYYQDTQNGENELNTNERHGEIEVFDVAEYREENTERFELSDEEEERIRKIMTQETSLESCQEQSEEEGYENIVFSEQDGVRVASIDVSSITGARSTKTVNPTMEDINDYQEVISWQIDASASVYHNILGRNIQSRVYLFADNFVEKTMETTYINMGLTLLTAATLCKAELLAFTTILGWASVAYSAAGILESFIFIDEQEYTYIAEKSGWTYDYISPNASGRHNGYAICYYNQTLGKITMGFDGTTERDNFHWVQTNPGIGDVYDLDNDYILERAYQIYTSAVVSTGMYDVGYDGRNV